MKKLFSAVLLALFACTTVNAQILRADDPVEKTQEIMRLLAIHERQMP